jgi:hypothetical protein
MRRTCPPPDHWQDIRPGNRIRFQSEGMPVEVEDLVVSRENGRLITAGGREILPGDYVLRLSGIPYEHDTAQPDLARLHRELERIGEAATSDLLACAQHLAARMSRHTRVALGVLRPQDAMPDNGLSARY